MRRLCPPSEVHAPFKSGPISWNSYFATALVSMSDIFRSFGDGGVISPGVPPCMQ